LKYNKDSFKEHYKWILYYSKFESVSTWDAEDLAHNVSIKLINKLNESNSKKVTRGYLRTMVKNTAIDDYRRSKVIEFSEYEEQQVNKLAIEEIVSLAQMIGFSLTEKQTKVFLLKEFYKFKSVEIAELLYMTEFAVKSVLHRAKKQLKKRVSNPDSVCISNSTNGIINEIINSILLNDPSPLIENKLLNKLAIMMKSTLVEHLMISHLDGYIIVQFLQENDFKLHRLYISNSTFDRLNLSA